MINIRTLGLKGSVGIKYKDDICTELCLKLWFESDYCFRNVTESGWFWKRLSRNKVSNNHFLKSVQKQPYTDVLQGVKVKLNNSKTPMLESLFNKADKETPTQVFSCEYCEIFINTYFAEHWRTAVSVCCICFSQLVILMHHFWEKKYFESKNENKKSV